MDLKDWKKLAEHEIYQYRANQAYVQAILDFGKLKGGEKMYHCAKWVLAVEYAESYLKKRDPLKARFFSSLYGLDGTRRRGSEARTIIALSIELDTSTATLYRWKNEALSLVLLAAAQTGALRPYTIDAQPPQARDQANQS